MTTMISKFKIVVWIVLIFNYLDFSAVHAFLIPKYRALSSYHQGLKSSIGTCGLFMSNDTDDGNEDESPKLSMRRVGGRAARFPVKNGTIKKGKRKLLLPVAVVLAAWLFFQNLFSAPGPSYVYYQSSVYETRIVGNDGKVETSRKENIKTNMPSLMEGRSADPSLLDRQFERQLDREVESMINEFF
mmetsp:Transcript_12636/g.18572  ORF Transcript_12636/g.18572 Transcript_12636/m.18572 type:complete len:187 (+) Transcript_12636:146-706(+)